MCVSQSVNKNKKQCPTFHKNLMIGSRSYNYLYHPKHRQTLLVSQPYSRRNIKCPNLVTGTLYCKSVNCSSDINFVYELSLLQDKEKHTIIAWELPLRITAKPSHSQGYPVSTLATRKRWSETAAALLSRQSSTGLATFGHLPREQHRQPATCGKELHEISQACYPLVPPPLGDAELEMLYIL